jgi:hypothetical protein
VAALEPFDLAAEEEAPRATRGSDRVECSRTPRCLILRPEVAANAQQALQCLRRLKVELARHGVEWHRLGCDLDGGRGPEPPTRTDCIGGT